MPAYKYTLKNGKTMWYANFYCKDWTGENKHICKRGFATQREAKEFERSYLNRQEASLDIPFTDLVENYMEDMGHRLKPTTMESKMWFIKSKVLPYFSKLKLSDIDSLTIRQWQNELLSYRDENGKPYSKTYLKSVNNQMSAIMNYAVQHYGLRMNPCHGAGSIGSSHADEMNIWTLDEYNQFIACEKRSAFRVAFDTLFYTGMRKGELLALTPSDILPERRIRINKNFAVVKGEELIMEPKTPKSNRNIAIPEFLYKEITEYVSKLYGIKPGDRIFYFTSSALSSEFKKLSEEAGLPHIRLHDLRHSHASMLIDMGVQPLEIAERLGHESVKTTLDTYSHLYPEKDTELASNLDKLWDSMENHPEE
ncbi:MAG: site-specific integrase [Clostridia bacterium]|nr:site-specific integrase [Clostridia bacterium]